jgi:hypothetical protein
MDMLMNGEGSVEAVSSCFLAGKYDVTCAIKGCSEPEA